MASSPGRPRLAESRRPELSAREEILDAAAELFTTKGYSATSTREIAEHVGIRQASLYHHFATKDAVLRELLLSTVEGALAVARQLLTTDGDPAVRLHALVRWDSAQLASSRWNLGVLYLMPEARTGSYAEFDALRTELRDAYAELSGAVLDATGVPAEPLVAELPLRLVESVINLRSDRGSAPDALSPRDPVVFADAALRLLGVREDPTAMRSASDQLLLTLSPQPASASGPLTASRAANGPLAT